MALLKNDNHRWVNDLTGQTFGRLNVVGATKARSNGGQVIWKCQCTCGHTTTSTGVHLRRFRQDRSCGKCVRPGNKPRDLTGQKFGHLTAIKTTGKRDGRGIYWLVKCECGTELERTVASLCSPPRRPNQILKSCGCIGKRNRSPKYKGVGDLSSTKFRGVKSRAKQRGIPFKITIKHAWELFLAQDKRCSLTGVLLTMSPSSVEKGASTASLDRIDSSRGYVQGNVQWVHVEINYMKHSLPQKDFVKWCQLVVNHAMAFGKEFGIGTKEAPWLY